MNECYVSIGKPECLKCGSKNIQKYGFVYSKKGKQQKIKCKDCGYVGVIEND